MGVEVMRVGATVLVLAGVLMLVTALIELITMAATPAASGEAPSIDSPEKLLGWGIPGVLLLAFGGYLLTSLQHVEDREKEALLEGEADFVDDEEDHSEEE